MIISLSQQLQLQITILYSNSIEVTELNRSIWSSDKNLTGTTL